MRSKLDRSWLALLLIIAVDLALMAGVIYMNFFWYDMPAHTVQLSVSNSAVAETKPVSVPISKFPHISVPKIGASSYLNRVGVTADGNMDIPKSPLEAGIFSDGASPGQNGTAVIAGHMTNYGLRAIFTDLHKLAKGDLVYIIADANTTYKYEVTGSQEYDIDDAPLEKIFGATEDASLNLITCSGKWDKGRDTYKKRLVVFTKLIVDS